LHLIDLIYCIFRISNLINRHEASMGVQSYPHFPSKTEDRHLLALLQVTLEQAGRGCDHRRDLASHLRALLAALERDATPVVESVARLHTLPTAGATSNAAADEYWSGYRAFAGGETLTGWTDTPFAQGWLAAALKTDRRERQHPL
jgi:hypothetical protein